MKPELEEFELPSIKDNEIMVKFDSNSICMRIFNDSLPGANKNKASGNVVEKSLIAGNDLMGKVVRTGSQWTENYKAGDDFYLQPALNYFKAMDYPWKFYNNSEEESTYIVLPFEVMDMDCMLPYKIKGLYKTALSKPYSCVIGACRALFRTDKNSHNHYMGIKEGGRMAIIGDCGPLGLAAIDYALSGEFRPLQLIVTDNDNNKLERARNLFEQKAESRSVSLLFINTEELEDPHKSLMRLTEHEGFSDVLVMIPDKESLGFAESLMAYNGCLNFLAGTDNVKFSAPINYYDIRYQEKHIIGSSTCKQDDMKEALELMEDNMIWPEVLITHIGGIDSINDDSIEKSGMCGGEKLIYTGISLPLTSLEDIVSQSEKSELFKNLAVILKKNKGLWCLEAENFLIENGDKI